MRVQRTNILAMGGTVPFFMASHEMAMFAQ